MVAGGFACSAFAARDRLERSPKANTLGQVCDVPSASGSGNASYSCAPVYSASGRFQRMCLRALLLGFLLTNLIAFSANPPVSSADFEQLYPNLEKLYVDLHQSPELSLHEQKTAEKLVSQLKPLGYEVTSGVGGYGVVAVLRNGTGPNVLLRTDTDALPVEEKTGLPFASKVRTP